MVNRTTRDRLLMITFDLRNPAPGDSRYRGIDRYLGAIGTIMRPHKQTRMLVTSMTPAQILAGIRSRIGSRCNAAVIRVSRRSQIFVHDRAIGASVARAIRQHGSP